MIEQENLKLNLALDEVIKMKENSKSSKAAEPTEKFKKVFVGNLNFSTNWQKLKDYMKKAGNVLFADVFLDQKGRSKGCGLVEFSEHEEAIKAIQSLNDTKLDGRYIYIREDNLSLAKKNDSGLDRERSRSRNRSKERKKSISRDRKFRSISRENNKHRRRDSKDKKNKKKSKSKEHISKSKPRSRSFSREKIRSKSKGKRERDHKRSRENDRRKNSRKSKSMQRNEVDGYEIYIKNLPLNLSWQNLKDAFQGFGKVLKAEVDNDDSGKSKGQGYVIFERKKEALSAIDNMHHTMFNGKELSVRLTRR